MATAGPNSPSGTPTQDATNQIGTSSWTNLGNVLASDNVYATDVWDSLTQEGQLIVATGFGFSLPAGSTVSDIKVEVEAKSSIGGSYASFGRAKAVKAGVLTGTTFPGTPLNTTDAYCSTNGLFGTTWTETDINAANFGCAVSFGSNGGSAPTISVDHIRITVTYTVEAPAAPNVMLSPGLRAKQTGELFFNFASRLLGQPGQTPTPEIAPARTLPKHYDKLLENNITYLFGQGNMSALSGRVAIESARVPQKPGSWVVPTLPPPVPPANKINPFISPPGKPIKAGELFFNEPLPQLLGLDTALRSPGQVLSVEFAFTAQRAPRHYDRAIENQGALNNTLRNQIFPQPGTYNILPAQRPSPHYDKLSSANALYLYGQDVVFGAAGQVFPIEIDDARTPLKHYAKLILNLSALQDLLSPVFPVRPIEIFLTQPRPEHFDRQAISNNASRLIGTDSPVDPIEIFSTQRPPRTAADILFTIATQYYGTEGPSNAIPIHPAQTRPRPPGEIVLNYSALQDLINIPPRLPIEIPPSQTLSKHYAKLSSNDASRLLGLDIVFGAPGQSPPIQIINFVSRKLSGDILNNNKLVLYPIVINPFLPIQTIDFQPRKTAAVLADIVYNLNLYIILPINFPAVHILEEVDRYISTIEVPAYIQIISIDVYQSNINFGGSQW